ncbi:hypothetical protein OAF54_03185 [bacterium]|nr:hypothetical protein [bacterium]
MTIANIKSHVCEKYDVTWNEIVSKRRASNICLARKEMMYLLKYETGLSYPEAGAILKRDHSSVIHGARAFSLLLEDGRVKKTYNPKAVYINPDVTISLNRAFDRANEQLKTLLSVRIEKDPTFIYKIIELLKSP